MDEPKRRWKAKSRAGEKDNLQSLPVSKKVKTAKGRKPSSTRWLQRHFSDPYVKAAQKLGLRSRSAFKLQELNDQFKFFFKGCHVVDLGAAPGGWTQIALEKGAGRVVGIDLLRVDPLPGAEFLQMDFTEEETLNQLNSRFEKGADLVLSDMAVSTIGHRQADRFRTESLAEMSADFALNILKPGGGFIAKVFQGGGEAHFVKLLKDNFKTVKHVKPAASRPESPEMYILALSCKKAGDS